MLNFFCRGRGAGESAEIPTFDRCGDFNPVDSSSRLSSSERLPKVIGKSPGVLFLT